LKNIFIFLHWKWPAHRTGTVPVVPTRFRSLLGSKGQVWLIRLLVNMWVEDERGKRPISVAYVSTT